MALASNWPRQPRTAGRADRPRALPDDPPSPYPPASHPCGPRRPARKRDAGRLRPVLARVRHEPDGEVLAASSLSSGGATTKRPARCARVHREARAERASRSADRDPTGVQRSPGRERTAPVGRDGASNTTPTLPARPGSWTWPVQYRRPGACHPPTTAADSTTATAWRPEDVDHSRRRGASHWCSDQALQLQRLSTQDFPVLV